jgi:GntR family transcriptional regulator
MENKETSLLQKESPIPLYYQLKEILKNQIESGKLKAGKMIPSEREMIDLFQISRPTVRQAINELVSSGLLVRKQGYGTFVNKTKQSQWYLESLSSFSEENERKGLSTKTKVLKMEIVDETIQLNSLFQKNYNEYYHIERLRFVEEQPVVLVSTYIPCTIAPDLDKENLTDNSLYNILQQHYNLKIDYAERTLEAVIVDSNDYELLTISPESPVQLVKTLAYLENGDAFEYSVSRFRGDLSSFKAKLKFNKK